MADWKDNGDSNNTSKAPPAVKVPVKFTGRSLASACNSAIKSFLKNQTGGMSLSNDSNRQLGVSVEIERTGRDSRRVGELLRNDTEEEEDSSDICSLPECDSDLLEVNPDAPHINSLTDVIPSSFEGVTPAMYQSVPSGIHSNSSIQGVHSFMDVHNAENIDGIIEDVSTEGIGLLLLNAQNKEGKYENDIESDCNSSPICIYSSAKTSPCVVDDTSSPSAAVVYSNEPTTVASLEPQNNLVIDETAVHNGSNAAADHLSDLTDGNAIKISVTDIQPANENAAKVSSLLVKPSEQQSVTGLFSAKNDVIPSTTPFLLMQKMLRGETDLHLPPDPKRWSAEEVSRFLKWLVLVMKTEAPLISYDEFEIDGKLLFKIRKRNLQRLFPESAIDTLWMHVEALKFASVTAMNIPNLQAANAAQLKLNIGQHSTTSTTSLNSGPANRAKASTTEGYSSPGSGQIQLWQFLLELLTERNMSHIICWVEDEGAFKLVDPERVAQLWGERKNKPSMNYEKLSRALRYYYDGDLIHKVCGKRFVYQFVCDLKMLLGYSAAELSQLVNER